MNVGMNKNLEDSTGKKKLKESVTSKKSTQTTGHFLLSIIYDFSAELQLLVTISYL